jgi:hypothetical protein
MQRVMCVLEVLMAYTYAAKIRDRGIGDSSLLYTLIIIIATSIGSQKCLIPLWYIGVMTCFTKGYRLSTSAKNALPSCGSPINAGLISVRVISVPLSLSLTVSVTVLNLKRFS